MSNIILKYERSYYNQNNQRFLKRNFKESASNVSNLFFRQSTTSYLTLQGLNEVFILTDS